MRRELISEAVGRINSQYIEEAERCCQGENGKKRGNSLFVRTAAAAVLCLVIGGIGIFSPLGEGGTVTAYAQGTGEAIPAAGAVVGTGSISDDGEMKGKPLFFYLAGEKIKQVRFSCKNQQISFTDWTETREEFGLAQNFTVPYGEDESQYYYLLIDWVPNATCKALGEEPDMTVKTLPRELREDMIVMEISFLNGRTETKVISVRLMDDGTFFASFGDYKITSQDSFVHRPDSQSVPREILYGPGEEKMEGDSSSGAAPVMGEALREEAAQAARDYYAATVFEVVSMEVERCKEDEISFSVCVSKGGIIQEPNRSITLQAKQGGWEVVSEGY